MIDERLAYSAAAQRLIDSVRDRDAVECRGKTALRRRIEALLSDPRVVAETRHRLDVCSHETQDAPPRS